MPLEVPELGYRATVAASIRRAADLWGDRDFIVMPERRMTFADAEAASRRLARQLLAAGVGKGTRVGIYDTYSTEWVVAWLAVMRIGALAMPFSSVYRPAELATVLRVGDVHTLLVPPSLLGRSVCEILEEVAPALPASTAPLRLEQLPYLRQVWVWGPSDRAWARTVSFDEGDDAVPESLLDAVEEDVVLSDWAQVTYTSGSSALPKGVVHSHGAIIRTTALSAQATTLSPVQAEPPCCSTRSRSSGSAARSCSAGASPPVPRSCAPSGTTPGRRWT